MGHVDTCKLLLKHGARHDSKDDGRSQPNTTYLLLLSAMASDTHSEARWLQNGLRLCTRLRELDRQQRHTS